MPSTQRTLMKLLQAGLAGAGLTALGLAATAVPALAQSQIRIGLAEDPDVLDPTLARTYVGRIVFASLCDKLFEINDKLALVPQLALSSETSADGKAVTLKLRPGVKFHDGEPMDAAAVKFSLERHLTMPGSFRKSEIASIDTIEVVDPLTVKLNLKAAFAPLIAQLADRAGMMVSPKAAKDSGDKFGLKPVCAGPFKFVERVQQDRIVLEKFADYWNKDQVLVDKVVFRPITEAAVRLANLKSGSLDLIERVLATDTKDIKANPKLKIAQQIELGYQGITLNIGAGEMGKNGPFGKDPRVAQALELAIDRDGLNQVVYNGEAQVGNQWVSPANAYYQEKFPLPKRDVAKARQLLKDAGVTTPLAIDFMVPNTSDARQIGEVVQSMAAEAGFDMKIRLTEFATSLNEAEAGRYHAYVLAWSGRVDPDGNIYTFAHSTGPNNYSKYSDPEVDAALTAARVAGGVAERKVAYEKVSAKILSGAGGIIYLFHRPVIIAHSVKLEGYKQLPDGLIRLQGVKLAP